MAAKISWRVFFRSLANSGSAFSHFSLPRPLAHVDHWGPFSVESLHPSSKRLHKTLKRPKRNLISSFCQLRFSLRYSLCLIYKHLYCRPVL